MISSAKEFIDLCLSSSPEERRKAKTDEVSEEILLEVLEVDPELADCVIWNNFVTPHILEMLSDHPDWRIRCSVAAKNKLSVELIEKLSRDEHESIRHSIARHRRTPEHILHILANDSWDVVAEIARKRLESSAL